MKKHRNIFQTKEQDETPETDLNKMEINDLPDKEFKIMVKKIFTEVRRTMHGHLNEEIEYKKGLNRKTKRVQ